MKKSICLLSFSPIHRDSRVLRQIKYLAPYYDLTVIGYGEAHPDWKRFPSLHWLPVQPSKLKFFLAFFYLLLGKIYPQSYERWYWLKPQHRQALEYLRLLHFDAIYANEWDSLPLAVRAASPLKTPIIFDIHEYTPGQYKASGLLKKWLLLPAVKYLMRRYSTEVTASITVSEPIADRLKQEFQLNPFVVLNVPDYQEPPAHQMDPNKIKMIHHGIAQRNRHLECMIQTLALCDHSYHLYFMLVEHDHGYVKELQELAEKIAPGRVHFKDPVSPERIITALHQYDIGFFILKPVHDSYLYALPNKFFDFIMAGLAVCIGPSPAMANLVQKHGFGCVASSFEPQDVARVLNKTDVNQWEAMRDAAREAAKIFNAENEMSKMLNIVNHCLNEK